MRPVVQKIDRALKSLYRISTPQVAEDFLIKSPSIPMQVPGALLIQTGTDLNLGIYLSPSVRSGLTEMRRSQVNKMQDEWSSQLLNAFSVATEEVSHFHSLLHRYYQGSEISQLEMELQGEIDKFLITFFASVHVHQRDSQYFYQLWEKIFKNYRLVSGLDAKTRQRYEEANEVAKAVILKLSDRIWKKEKLEEGLTELRKFYRLSLTQKISFPKRK